MFKLLGYSAEGAESFHNAALGSHGGIPRKRTASVSLSIVTAIAVACNKKPIQRVSDAQKTPEPKEEE